MKTITPTKVYIVGMLLSFTADTIAGSNYMISAGNKKQPFASYYSEYTSCKSRANQKPSRGEYETREEYQKRLKNMKGGCDAYKYIRDANIIVPVSLSYDVDNEKFSFKLAEKSGELKIDYKHVVRDGFSSSKYDGGGPWGSANPSLFGCGKKSTRPATTTERDTCRANVKINKKYFYKAKSEASCKAKYRSDNVKLNMGCQRYVPDGSRWEKIDYEVGEVRLFAFTPVQTARRIKVSEPNLVYRITGTMDVSDKKMNAAHIEVVNRENEEVLFSVGSR